MGEFALLNGLGWGIGHCEKNSTTELLLAHHGSWKKRCRSTSRSFISGIKTSETITLDKERSSPVSKIRISLPFLFVLRWCQHNTAALTLIKIIAQPLNTVICFAENAVGCTEWAEDSVMCFKKPDREFKICSRKKIFSLKYSYGLFFTLALQHSQRRARLWKIKWSFNGTNSNI